MGAWAHAKESLERRIHLLLNRSYVRGLVAAATIQERRDGPPAKRIEARTSIPVRRTSGVRDGGRQALGPGQFVDPVGDALRALA